MPLKFKFEFDFDKTLAEMNFNSVKNNIINQVKSKNKLEMDLVYKDEWLLYVNTNMSWEVKIKKGEHRFK